MKFWLINSIVLFFSIQMNCQNNYYVNWENPNNFLKNNLNKVSVYSYEVKKNGKLKKDSLLLRKYEYDKTKSIIAGINNQQIFYSHGNASSLSFYKFENQYIKDTLVETKIETPITKNNSEKNDLESSFLLRNFTYNNFNNIIKQTFYNDKRIILLYKKDTLSCFKTINNPKVLEYEYDENQQIRKHFISTDSTQYFSKFNMRSDLTISKSCVYCQERYLSQEWKYKEGKLIETISYNYKKGIHFKTLNYYDENLKLIKQIDSTGFYNGRPILSSITEIKYDGNYKTKIKINFDENSYFKEETKKYVSNELVYELAEAEYPKNNIETTYGNFENSLNKYKSVKYGQNETIKFEYFYNSKGLLKEQKHFISNKLISIERYYYE